MATLLTHIMRIAKSSNIIDVPKAKKCAEITRLSPWATKMHLTAIQKGHQLSQQARQLKTTLYSSL